MKLFSLFTVKKTPAPEGPTYLLERLSEIEIRVKSVERTLDEQHDFIRRLASRRAKEEQVERARGAPPARLSSSPDEPVVESKADLRRRALHLLRSGSTGESS